MPDILDLFTLIGPVPPHAPTGSGPQELRELLTRYGVSGAVTISTRSIYYDAATGNEEARTVCASDGGGALLPGAVLDPRQPRPETTITGSRLLYLMPTTQGWPTAFAPVDLLLRHLAAANVSIPLWWEVHGCGDATAAANLLRAANYTGAVILGGVTGSAGLVEAITVAGTSDRIFIATDSLRGVGQVELAARALGPQRVVFASGAPAVSLRSALALVRLANLGPENEEMVFSGNARRILGSGSPATATAAAAAGVA